MTNEIPQGAIAAADRRLVDLDNALDRMVCNWTTISVHCGPEGCKRGGGTEDIVEFCSQLMNSYHEQSKSLEATAEELVEMLALAVRRISNVPQSEPKHMFKATSGTEASCTCGDFAVDAGELELSFAAWEQHADGSGLKVFGGR